jgi:hypothetical protein
VFKSDELDFCKVWGQNSPLAPSGIDVRRELSKWP